MVGVEIDKPLGELWVWWCEVRDVWVQGVGWRQVSPRGSRDCFLILGMRGWRQVSPRGSPDYFLVLGGVRSGVETGEPAEEPRLFPGPGDEE